MKFSQSGAPPVDSGRQLPENRQTCMNSEHCLPGHRWRGFLLGRRWGRILA